VKEFNGHAIKTLDTEEELKKKKLTEIANGLREATDGALKLRSSLADQVHNLIFSDFLSDVFNNMRDVM